MNTINCEALKTQMDKILTFAQVSHKGAGIAANIDAWSSEKWKLINILRRHPNWNEDAMAIILSERVAEGVDASIIRTTCAELNDALYLEGLDEARCTWQLGGPDWTELAQQTISEDSATYWNKLGWGKCATAKAGQKTSRYIRKLLLGMGVPKDCAPVWKKYAELADALNPITMSRPLIISVNPSDYLMMSYGDNWSSCHIINPDIVKSNTSHYSGQSKIGCLSYMTDACSIITYAVDKLPADLSDLPITPRHTRQMFMLHLESNLILQSRMYPYTHDQVLIDARRTIVQGVIAECLSLPNLWRKRATNAGFTTNGRHYPDYNYVDKFEISVSYQADRELEYENEQCIGSPARCVQCGREVTCHDSVICDHCLNEGKCQYCGGDIDLDDPNNYITIDGNNYHTDCVFWCDHCHEWHGGHDYHEVVGVGLVCVNALYENSETYTRLCEGAQQHWILKADLPEAVIQIGDTFYTDEASAEWHGYYKCAQCGRWVTDWCMHRGHDSQRYCNDCVVKAYVTCEHGHRYNRILQAECPHCRRDSVSEAARDAIRSIVDSLNF